MIPNIPDNIFKILFAVGLFLIGYSYLQIEKDNQQNTDLSRKFDMIKDSLDSRSKLYDAELDRIKYTADDLARKYGVKSPVMQKGNNYDFNRILRGSKNDVIVSEAIEKLWARHIGRKPAHEEAIKRLNRTLDQLNEDIRSHNDDKVFWYNGPVLGFLLAFFGLLGMMYHQTLQNKFLLTQISEKAAYKECQSCAKKFNATVQNAKFPDGGINGFYCTECFTGGGFSNPSLTMDEALANYLAAMRKPDFFDRAGAKSKFLSMQRWKHGSY